MVCFRIVRNLVLISQTYAPQRLYNATRLRDKQVTVTAAQKSSSIAPKIFWKSVSDINGLLLKVAGGSAGDLGPDGHSIKLDYPPLPLFDPPCDYCVSVGVICGRTHASQKCCPCVLRRKGCARGEQFFNLCTCAIFVR